MAKESETVELCRIHADTTLDQMGHVLAALARMNVANVGYELVTEISTFKKKTVHDTKAEEFATEWLQENPTFRANELIKYFEQKGRTAGAAYTSIRTLLEKGVVKKTSPGHYQRADVKALAPPTTTHYEISNRDLIWQIIGKRKKFTVAEMTEAFKTHKRPSGSATSTVSKLVKDKEVKALGEGKYEVIGRKVASHKPAGVVSNLTSGRYEVSNKDFILQRIKGRSKISVKEMEEVFTANKRNPRSVSAVFSGLISTDPPILTKAEEAGIYLVNKPPKANGQASAMTETANG